MRPDDAPDDAPGQAAGTTVVLALLENRAKEARSGAAHPRCEGDAAVRPRVRTQWLCAHLLGLSVAAWLTAATASCDTLGLTARTDAQVGLACLDLSLPGLFLSQSVEQAAYPNAMALLQQFAPHAIICCGSSATGVADLAKTFHSSARIVCMARSQFDDTRGRSAVRLIAHAGEKDVASKRELYLAMAAANACLQFCSDELQLLVLPDSLTVRQELPARHVHIDAATVANLELLSPLGARGGIGSRGSLFGLLNCKTTTKGGGACAPFSPAAPRARGKLVHLPA